MNSAGALLAVAGCLVAVAAACATLPPVAPAPGPAAVEPMGAGGRVDGGYELRGQVLARGMPFAGAEILVDGQVAASSDDSGQFTLRAERAEPWVVARAGSQLSGVVHVDGYHPPPGSLSLALGPASSLQGWVRDAQSGVAVGGAQVVVDDAHTAATEASGAFVVSSFSGSGDDSVVITAPGYAVLHARVDLSLRRPMEAVFLLSRGRGALIRVQSAGGRAIGGATVEVTDGDSVHVFDSATSASDGRATFDHLPMGLLLVRAASPGWAGASVPVSTPEVTLILDPESTLEGAVLTADHRPVAGGKVELRMSEPASAQSEAAIDVHGAFGLRDLSAGSYRVTAVVPGHPRAAMGVIELGSGEHRRADLTLPDAPLLTGRVTDAATGAPISGARIGLGGPEAEIVPAATGADGSFEVACPGLDPVRLRVEADGFVPREVVERPGSSAQVALEHGLTVRGRVLDADGQALQGAAIDDDDATGSDGRFDVRRPAVTRRISISRFGSLGAEVPFAVTSSGIVDVGDVRLREGIEVHLAVEDPSGNPVPGAEIFGAGEGPLARKEILRGALPEIGVTNAQGQAALRVAPIKSCAVAVHPAWAPSGADQCPLDLEREGQTAVLRLTAPAFLEGQISRSEPGPDAAVSSDESVSALPEAGRYRVGPLSPGRHDFFAFDGFAHGHPTRVWFWQGELAAGQTLRHDFGDPDGGSLQVEVRHLRARTVMVGLLREEAAGRGSATMIFVEPSSGVARVSLPAIPAGEYKLAVSDGMDTGGSRMVPITVEAHQARQQSLDFEAMLPAAPGS